MQKFYNLNMILEVLKTFKVNKVVLSGIKDKNLIKNIFNHTSDCIQLNSSYGTSIEGDPLTLLQNLEDYDAIFINDDSNWFTVFNELKIIKKTNKDFPLVFICNNNFPNKRRDSYSNPQKIPSEFRNKYTNKLPICHNDETIIIHDGFYHACEENTPKNGVFTAIEDFLKENIHIGMMEINFIEEISILYSKSQINQKRISIITKNISDNLITNINLPDKLKENHLLFSYIDKYKSKEEDMIKDYKNKIRIQNNEIILKETQLDSLKSKINLKDSQIKKIESKLLNKENKIDFLENNVNLINNDLNSMNKKLEDKNIEINELYDDFKRKKSHYDDKINFWADKFNKKLTIHNAEIDSLINDFKQKESNYNNQINSNKKSIKQKDVQIKTLQHELDEYVEEINSLKNDFTIKEKNFNNQINSNKKSIKQKDVQIKTLQHELDEKKIKIDSLEYSYIKQSSKIDNKEYCISCFKEEISNNNLEINYLKNNTLTKKVLNPISYLYLILKSNPKEISLNIKLFQALKDSEYFDIGFYLNKNKDLIGSRWCKYFSLELHYVCKGFSENRLFNKKYINSNSKKDLLEYISTEERDI